MKICQFCRRSFDDEVLEQRERAETIVTIHREGTTFARRGEEEIRFCDHCTRAAAEGEGLLYRSVFDAHMAKLDAIQEQHLTEIARIAVPL